MSFDSSSGFNQAPPTPNRITASAENELRRGNFTTKSRSRNFVLYFFTQFGKKYWSMRWRPGSGKRKFTSVCMHELKKSNKKAAFSRFNQANICFYQFGEKQLCVGVYFWQRVGTPRRKNKVLFSREVIRGQRRFCNEERSGVLVLFNYARRQFASIKCK